MRILILHDQLSTDARPDEADALVQANTVQAALARAGHSCEIAPATLALDNLVNEIRRREPDLVFNLVESLGGHGRLIHLVPDLLDALGVAYTGCPSAAVYLTSHKVLAKRLMALHGLATPAWLDAVAASPDLPFPERYIIKSVWEDASLGLDDDSVCLATSPDALRAEVMTRAPQLGGEAVAEQYIEGREFNLAMLAGPDGPQALPPAEMQFIAFPPDKPRIVGYAAKWASDSFEYAATVRRFDFDNEDRALLVDLERIALDCWSIFGLRGYARVDFRVDETGRPWVLEVNANPCLAPDAGFMAAAERAGLPSDAVVERIQADAVRAGACVCE